jgi:GT2 family glycosyltransferase
MSAFTTTEPIPSPAPPPASPNRPAASLVITTRNRRAELRAAIRSGLDQTAVDEILVIDDASDDGTSEMVLREFPQVRYFRTDSPTGYIALRNFGNARCRNEFVVSIDDDATFSTNRVVDQALRSFAHPRVGAVAVPYVNVKTDPGILQSPPSTGEDYLTEAYVGTAHVLRRELFLELGGYRERFVHQGEETDFGLRLSQRGYHVCLARADPILHHESPRRSFARMDYYGRRNDCLIALWNTPLVFLPTQLLGTILGGLAFGLRLGRPWAMLRGSLAGLCLGLRHLRERQPVDNITYRRFKRLRHLRKSRYRG